MVKIPCATFPWPWKALDDWWASQSSKWLSMNVLSISPTCIVAEEQEVDLHALLEAEGFEVIKVPFRAVCEFGGGLHCATWDTLREDAADDFFPAEVVM